MNVESNPMALASPRNGGRSGIHDRSTAPRAGGTRFGPVRFSATQFLVVLLLLMFVSPFIDRDRYGQLVEALSITVVMLSAVLAIGGRPRTLAIAMLLVLPAVGGKWIEHWRPEWIPAFLVPTASIVFLAFVLAQFMRFILRAPIVSREVVCAGAAAYVLLGWLWMFGYILVERFQPLSFAVFGRADRSLDGFEMLYFSFVTLVGIAYGDITPLSKVAQMLAVLEGTIGTLFIVVLIARLVALYTPRQAALTHEKGTDKP